MQASLSLAYGRTGGYPVHFQSCALSGSSAELTALLSRPKVLIVTTPTPWRLHGVDRLPALARAAGAEVDVLVLPLSEATKTMDSVLAVCRRASALGLGRADLMVAFGGGLVADIVTVAAATLRRGTPYACLPTTLVGQVDAGVGIKGAVNLDGAKNQLGCFHPPVAVISDPAWLQTLDDRSIRSGLAEIIKVGVVRETDLFTAVESAVHTLLQTKFAEPEVGRDILVTATRAMLDELSLTPFEDQLEPRLMDFGHTYSPTIESASGYSLTHGEAVAVDIALSTEIAVRLDRLDREHADRIHQLLEVAGLPLATPWCSAALVRNSFGTIARQRGGALNLVLPVGIGKGDFVDDVPDDVIASAVAALSQRQAG